MILVLMMMMMSQERKNESAGWRVTMKAILAIIFPANLQLRLGIRVIDEQFYGMNSGLGTKDTTESNLIFGLFFSY
mgnify:CR=1 FL=1